MVNDAFLAEVAAASDRYDRRSDERAEARRVLDSEGVLHADRPDRVTNRLARLNADWTLARAVERTRPGPSTGRNLPDVEPARFGADVLGLERLMGRNDLVDVGFLERGYRAARAVGRITIRAGADGEGGHGTGFLVSPRLLLTNHHVLRTLEEAARSYVEFDYQAGLDGLPLTPRAFVLDPGAFFVTDEQLDFSAVAVQERSSSGTDLAAMGFLPLIEQEGKVILGERVNIVQHPNAEPKQLALRENQIVDVLDLYLHYETDTAPGSSGSPVFNDQWEVVALHHSVVPKRDAEGRCLATDGSLWTQEMGEDRLAWEANEGVRVSRVLRSLRAQQLGGSAAGLQAELLVAAGAPGPAAAAAPPMGIVERSAGAAPVPSLGTPAPAGATATWTVPLQVTVGVGAQLAAAPPPAPTASPPAAIAAAADPLVQAALVDLEANRAQPYYDEAKDGRDRDAYYRDVPAGAEPGALFAALSALVTGTHVRQPKYQPIKLVYPWVDLHPDRRIRSIYSGRAFSPEELIRADALVEALRTTRLQEVAFHEAAPGPEDMAAEIARFEESLPYNCEHSVPQSSFGAAEPMRGDLHHLFACESGCNSFRGNTPYFDFADFEEKIRHECGRREEGRFEPSSGKGAVARATLYFLLRYPGVVGDETRELQRDRLPTLLDWHRAHPVDDWERHRNMAIADVQGNRNPLIDHPEWAEHVDFALGLGKEIRR